MIIIAQELAQAGKGAFSTGESHSHNRSRSSNSNNSSIIRSSIITITITSS